MESAIGKSKKPVSIKQQGTQLTRVQEARHFKAKRRNLAAESAFSDLCAAQQHTTRVFELQGPVNSVGFLDQSQIEASGAATLVGPHETSGC